MITFKDYILQESKSSPLTEDEMSVFGDMKKAYKEMVYYQHRSRNPATIFAKNKFTDSYGRWNEAIKNAKKSFGTERGNILVDMIIKSVPKESVIRRKKRNK